jgi:hypothetical protein
MHLFITKKQKVLGHLSMSKPKIIKGNDLPGAESLIADEIAQIPCLDLCPFGLLKIGRNECIPNIYFDNVSY